MIVVNGCLDEARSCYSNDIMFQQQSSIAKNTIAPEALSKLPDVLVAGGKATMDEITKMQKAAEKCISSVTVPFLSTQAEANELVKKATTQKALLDSMVAALNQM